MESLTKNLSRSASHPWSNPFDRFFTNDLDAWDGDTPLDTIPSINIIEENDNYQIEMAAPGLKKDDFNINVDGNVMTISCEKESKMREGRHYSHREFNYCGFLRSFNIPDNADTNKAIAKYSDGILNLTIPKKAEMLKDKSQKIKVK